MAEHRCGALVLRPFPPAAVGLSPVAPGPHSPVLGSLEAQLGDVAQSLQDVAAGLGRFEAATHDVVVFLGCMETSASSLVTSTWSVLDELERFRRSFRDHSEFMRGRTDELQGAVKEFWGVH